LPLPRFAGCCCDGRRPVFVSAGGAYKCSTSSTIFEAILSIQKNQIESPTNMATILVASAVFRFTLKRAESWQSLPATMNPAWINGKRNLNLRR
jgi:hypothetical protein